MSVNKTLFIFLDESGNFDFSKNQGATEHYVLAAVTTISPLSTSNALQQLKYSLLSQGVDIECFHASEEKQAVRDDVFTNLNELSNDLKVHYLHAKKCKTLPSLQSSVPFYALLGTTLISYILNYQSNGYDDCVIVFDKALTKKEQKAFLGKIKPALKKIAKPYRIYFHQTRTDFNGQIADYFAWTKFVQLERNELRPIKSLQNITMTEFDLFKNGKKEWY